MDGHDLDGSAVRFDDALGEAGAGRPIVVQVSRELYEPAHTIIASSLEQTIDVRERAGGLIRTASGDDGAHAKPFDRFGEQQPGYGDAQSETNVAQDAEHLSREIVLHSLRIGMQRETGRLAARRNGKARGDRQQILLGEAHQRPPQQSAQGQGVARVGDAPDQRDEILGLLSLEQILAGL